MEINLYEEMNGKIADIIAIGNEPAFLYASAYIKQLRAENKAFKDKLESGRLVELNSTPLTIEQLKSLKVGDWVWVVDKEIPEYTGYYKIGLFAVTHLHLVQGLGKTVMPYALYGTKWQAWKNKEQAEARLKELQEK